MSLYNLPLTDAFIPIDKLSPIELQSINVNDFTIEITIKNGVASNEFTVKKLKTFFGGVDLKVESVDGEQASRILISRIQVPDDGYEAHEVLKYIEENKERGLYLGIGKYGPEHLDLSDLTHGFIFGSTGYGKSVFLKFMVAQIVAYYPEVVCHLVDPKQVDFIHYKNHPNIGLLATTAPEWESLLAVLIGELGYRSKLFSNSFTTPPTDLKQYHEFKEKFERDDLPELKRHIVVIDEADLAIGDYSHTFHRTNLETIFKRGRAFGIHLILSTQNQNGDGMGREIKNCINTNFAFFTPGPSGYDYEDVVVEKENEPVRGRLHCKVKGEKVTVQAPFITSEDSLALAFSQKRSTENSNSKGITRLKMNKDAVENGVFASLITSGLGIDAGENDLTTHKRGNRHQSQYPFAYEELYELFENMTVQEKKEKTEQEKAAEAKLWEERREEMKQTAAILQSKKSEEQKKKEAEEWKGLEDQLKEKLANLGENVKVKSLPKEEPKTVDALLDQFSYMLGDGPRPIAESTGGEKVIITKKINQYDNTPDIPELIRIFKENLEKSTNNLHRYRKDLSNNKGLIELLKGQKLENEQDRDILKSTADLALPKEINDKLYNYTKDVVQARKEENKAPLLILTGPTGIGKNTIASTLLSSLGISFRFAKREDLEIIHKVDDDQYKEILGGTKEEKVEEEKQITGLIFHSKSDAITFNRHCPSSFINVLIEEPTPKDFFGSNSNNDFRFITEPHHHISLSEEHFKEERVANKLIAQILKMYNYRSEQMIVAKEWAELGITIKPMIMGQIIERASRVAEYRNTEFDFQILHEVFETLKVEKVVTNPNVKIVSPQRTMEELFVHDETKRDIFDIIHKAKCRSNRNFEFAKKLRKGNRATALFTGEPGTGKSMAAEVIANELNRPLWVCDIGQLKSKFVGDTEKMFSDLFHSAETANVVLLLDEADTFLRSRDSEIASYERNQINHLLNLMEGFNGTLILTTNYGQALDSAMSRRCDIKAVFRMPDKATQAEILKSLLMPDAPLEDGINFMEIFETVDLSGGLIRNAVERALIKMEREGKDKLSQEILREGIVETYEENIIVENEKRKIGLI